MDYYDLAGTPPGLYSIDMYRLGDPSDGIGLHNTMSAGGGSNQIYSHQDTSFASAADPMVQAALDWLQAEHGCTPDG